MSQSNESAQQNVTPNTAFTDETIYVNESSRTARTMTGIAGGVATAVALKYGIAGSDLLDTIISPHVPVVPEIVEGFVIANDALRNLAPAVAVGSASAYMYGSLRARSSREKKTINELARTDYSGTEDMTNTQAPNKRHGLRGRRLAAGLGIAALTVLVTGGASGVEHEVSYGPVRAVAQTFDMLAPGQDNPHLLLQGNDPHLTFMGDSYISQADMVVLQKDALKHDITVAPFSKGLPDINNEPALIIGVPDELFAQATGAENVEKCDNIALILDDAYEGNVGDTVEVNGVKATVVKMTHGASQMNRHIGTMPQTQFDACIRKSTESPYYGASISGASTETIEKLIANSPLAAEANPIDQKKFEELNVSFWQKNGTPLLFQLIAWMGVMGVSAISGERRNAMQRNVREIGVLEAQGVSMKAIAKIERRRALGETLKATALAAPMMPLFAATFNAAELGLKVGVGAREVAVGFTVALAAKLGGSMRAIGRFAKNRNLALTVKG